MGNPTTPIPTSIFSCRIGVQGVGLRPFVYSLRLCGFVLNSSATVEIEIEVHQSALEALTGALAGGHGRQL